jgi:hypothetical protein
MKTHFKKLSYLLKSLNQHALVKEEEKGKLFISITRLSVRIELGMLRVQSVKSLGVEGKGSILGIAFLIAAPHNWVQEIQAFGNHHVK